jgi:hypothetical protein
VFDHDFEDLKRGVGAHAPEESWRGGRLGSSPHLVESVPICPEGVNPPGPGCASQQLGAQKAVWYGGHEETTETSQQLSLAAEIDRRADHRQNALVHANLSAHSLRFKNASRAVAKSVDKCEVKQADVGSYQQYNCQNRYHWVLGKLTHVP